MNITAVIGVELHAATKQIMSQSFIFPVVVLKLRYLDLSYNSFHGTIPTFIGSLIKLRFLNLGNNNLNGTIPTSVGSLTELRLLSLSSDVSLFFIFNSSSSSIAYLYLGNNSLTSSMYRWLFPLTSNKLRVLDLSGNMLDGIPKYLGNLSSLETLSFYNNSAAVKFPDFLNNLSGCTSLSLQSLQASYNQFTGPLSDDIQKFSSLKHLYLSHNQLYGSISEKLWELPMLEELDLYFNNLQVPSTYHLSGLFLMYDTTPLEFWDMWPSQLKYLNLSSNNISGTVPDLSSNFATGSAIDLSSNNFSGPIPNVSSTLSSLNLSRNKFSGGISLHMPNC
ncbi:unnamed protein product [Lactuca virosa]|uniref:Non-specific serine/threonine protein kinase n=1 Tax=Lactuca virosa TaxID=75947 RepID=A0AAU9PQ40_9ASTR|nr:unnamed protein product [Lactuca virosa]